MAKSEPINVTVNLSPEDRKLLRGIATALGVPPEDEPSFADTTRRFVEAPIELSSESLRRLTERPRPTRDPTDEQREGLKRLLDGRSEPQPEGDWLLEAERAEAGDDVD